MKSHLILSKWSYIFATAVSLYLCKTEIEAAPSTATYAPHQYLTVQGADNGQSAIVLEALSNIGVANVANTYVALMAKSASTTYSGYRSYFIPNPSDTISALQVKVNFRGPDVETQKWTWQIYDWVYKGWVNVGNNSMALNKGPWTEFLFSIAGPLNNYVNPSSGEIRINVISNNSVDDAFIDSESIIVTNDSAAPKPGTAYFVATNGNDKNSGTLAAPWKTINYAAQRAQPGNTIYVRGGVYSERVVFNKSGSASGGAITFMSYPGEVAIIDATNLKISESAAGLFHFANVNYLTVQGFELRNIKMNSSRVYPDGISVVGKCNHIEIRQNYVHHISNGSHGAHGIAIYGTTTPVGVTNLVIDGNEVAYLTLGSSESVVLNGNVQFWKITNNRIHHNNNIGIDAAGYYKVASSKTYDRARNGVIENNLIYYIDGNSNPAYPPDANATDGIYVDGGSDIVINRNIVHHSNIGIEAASEVFGQTSANVVISNNFIYSNSGPGITIGGYSQSVGSTSNCTIANNTLFKNDTAKTGSGELQLQNFPSGITGNLIVNNLIYSGSQNILVSNPFKNPAATVDYNLYYTASTKTYYWTWKNVTYTNFSTYKSKTSNDAHSINGSNPLFADSANFIPYLLTGSPALNAGISIGADLIGPADLAGRPRVSNSAINIGAYE